MHKTPSTFKETQALIWNFLICIGNMIKDQFGLFLFSKTENIIEIWIKIVSLTANRETWQVCILTRELNHLVIVIFKL